MNSHYLLSFHVLLCMIIESFAITKVTPLYQSVLYCMVSLFSVVLKQLKNISCFSLEKNVIGHKYVPFCRKDI